MRCYYISSSIAILLTYYLYFLIGQLAENNSFYASLRAGPASQDQEPIAMPSGSFFNNGTTEWRFVFRKVGIIWHI